MGGEGSGKSKQFKNYTEYWKMAVLHENAGVLQTDGGREGVTCLIPCDMVMSFAKHCKFSGFYGTKCISKALNGMVPD